MLDNQEFIVYREWPVETIAEAVTDFNHGMRDGAGVDEIRAGLHGLDFLCRRSSISDDLQSRIDGAITEANMRISLISTKEKELLSFGEKITATIKIVENLGHQARYFLDTYKRNGAQALSKMYPANFTFEDEDEDIDED